MNHQLRFTAEKIGKRIALIRSHIHISRHPFEEFSLEELKDASAAPGEGIARGQVAWNSYWAGQNTHFVLRTEFEIPKSFQNPALFLPLGVAGDIFTHPEALLSIDGEIEASADRHHQQIPLKPALADGKQHSLMLHGWTGLTGWPPNPNNPERVQIRQCFVVDVDRNLERLVTLAECALDMAVTIGAGRLHDRYLQALDEAFLVLDTRDPLGQDFRASVKAALDALDAALAQIGEPEREKLHAIGHAHMDIAYLWPISQIRQKNARTTSNVLRLMERDPDYRFSHSQPQLYEYTEQDFPQIFEQMKQRIAEGRWELMGGMWVESDCNIPSGESLVRQILLGRSYFRASFDADDTPVLWLPDTFGFSWALPQLMKLAGLKYFVTNKMNWNQYNQMPSSSFVWEGIDGSRVIAQLLTTPRPVQHLPFPTNYKSDLSAAEVLGTVSNAASSAKVDEFMIAYGYGDGGGGPTEELLAKAHAYEAMPGAPRVQMSDVKSALETLETRRDALPVWSDELYMEGHRGVYTSQAWIKRANRLAERALHDTEAALVMAWPEGVPDEIVAKLTELWKRVCLNQFHDILTGTSVGAVFEDARQDYAWIQEQAEQLRAQAFEAMRIDDAPALFNPSPASSARLALSDIPHSGGQEVDEGWLIPIDPVKGYASASLREAENTPPPVMVSETADGFVLDNQILRATINRSGELSSLIHCASGRESLAPDALGNRFQAFEDRPLSWDAWDIDVFVDERAEHITQSIDVKLVATGPYRAVLEVTKNYRSSRITQRISLDAGAPRLDFATDIDWHEQHILLKVAFPVDVLSPRARYETQWGEIERPTHRNTSWDYAKFEVPAQKWADLSETGFGVALLNDCKYGYDISENVMRLTLLKSSTSPDPRADQGHHQFTYSVMPHEEQLQAVRDEARRLNDPLICVSGLGARKPILTCDEAGVIVETLKPAESGNGFIVRLYEAARKRGEARLTFAHELKSVSIVDLLEDPIAPLRLDENTVTLSLKPFEIVTLHCVPKSGKDD